MTPSRALPLALLLLPASGCVLPGPCHSTLVISATGALWEATLPGRPPDRVIGQTFDQATPVGVCSAELSGADRPDPWAEPQLFVVSAWSDGSRRRHLVNARGEVVAMGRELSPSPPRSARRVRTGEGSWPTAAGTAGAPLPGDVVHLRDGSLWLERPGQGWVRLGPPPRDPPRPITRPGRHPRTRVLGGLTLAAIGTPPALAVDAALLALNVPGWLVVGVLRLAGG